MFSSYPKSTGTRYTAAVASLVVALAFTPALFVMTGSWGYVPLAIALGFSTLSLSAAWMSWKRYSNVTVPSIHITELEARVHHRNS